MSRSTRIRCSIRSSRASRHELDETKRNQLYRQADSIAFVDAPMVFLYFYDELYAVQPWIKHFVPPVIFNGQRWTTVSIDTQPHVTRFIVRRLLLSIPTLFGVLVVAFLLLYVAPGDPVEAMVGERADSATIARLRQQLRLDDPLPQRFAHYVGSVRQGRPRTIVHHQPPDHAGHP